MGRTIHLSGTGTVAGPDFNPGDVVTYNSGGSHIEIISRGSTRPAVQWQIGGGGKDKIMMYPGTKYRPIPANGWLYTMGTDGYSSAVKDPNAATQTAVAPTKPMSRKPKPVYRSEVIQLAPAQYTGKTPAQLIAEAGGGYIAFGPKDGMMELVLATSSFLPQYQAKYAATTTSTGTAPPTPPPEPPPTGKVVYEPIPMPRATYIPPGAPPPPTYIPPGAPPPPTPGAEDQAIVEETGVPLWVWIVGGGAAVWAFSGRRR